MRGYNAELSFPGNQWRPRDVSQEIIESDRFSHLTLCSKANNPISQNVKLFLSLSIPNLTCS